MRILFYKVAMLLIIFTGVGIAVYAQTTTIKGVVIDAKSGESIPGALVVVKGTINGCATNINGEFKLIVPKTGILVISIVGYKTVEIDLSKWKGEPIKLEYVGEIITPESKSVEKNVFFISRKRVA